MRSTPTEMQSMNENDFECLAKTRVNTPPMAKMTDDVQTGSYVSADSEVVPKSASGKSSQESARRRLTDSQSNKDPIRSVHTMVSTPYRVDALTLCPKTCHRFSYTLVCRADPFARFRAPRTISSSGCWYCIAVLTSLWPIVFITAARFPVLFSTRVP